MSKIFVGHPFALFFVSSMCLLCTSFAPDPSDYPKDYFQTPVGHRLSLAGTFGELRPNHFHAGIDIRPARRGSSEPIFAAAEGYVSRIRVSASGYGNSLCITHPNGFTTLYAHLDHFSPEIAAMVEKEQYQRESFELDWSLSPSQIPMTRGGAVGMMGNTGSSQGMHLHFEIRETATENAINPLLFGFDVPDDLAPTLQGLKVYGLNDRKQPQQTQTLSLQRRANNTYGIAGDTLRIAAPQVAFALNAHDRQNGDSGENGIYSLETLVDSMRVFRFSAEKINFDQNRALNAHIDYPEQLTRRTMLHRAWSLENDQNPMLENVQNAGVIVPKATPQQVTLAVRDAANNLTMLTFWVVAAAETVSREMPPHQYDLQCRAENVIQENGLKVFFPLGALYEDLPMRFDVARDGSHNHFSPTYRLHDYQTPLHKPIEVQIMPENLPDALRSKAFIAYCQRDDYRVYSCGGAFDAQGFLTAKLEKLGNYCIVIDQTPPTVTLLSNLSGEVTVKKGKKTIRRTEKITHIRFRVRDNIETVGRETPDLTFRATIDDQWRLMEYDAKTDIITHRLDERTPAGEHIFRLSVKDNRGNETVFEQKFTL